MSQKHRFGLVFLLLLLAACEPQDRRPGNWLSGERVETKILDWTFSNDYEEVFLQTHPWYLVPHSVTVVTATSNGHLYVPSVYYAEPMTFPEGKYWNRVVSKNPNIEVKIGDRLYPRSVHIISDEKEFEQALNALAEKYPFWKTVKDLPEDAPAFVLMRLDDPTDQL